MPKINKPLGINKIWSSAGDNTAPTDTKLNLGWISEVPPRQTFNYLDNKQDAAIAAMNQSGIPEWDAVTEYQGNFSHVLGSNGTVYKAKVTNTNVNPVTDTANTVWKVAFAAADGSIPFTGKLTITDGTAASPAYGFNTFTNTGIFGDPISAALGITVAGTEKVRVNQSSTEFKTAVSLEVLSTGITPALNDNTTKLATTEFVQSAVANAAAAVIPAGAVMPFAMAATPNGWLSANGAAVSRTVFVNLFAAIGTTYGAGDGTTTFNLPDLRGEFLRGVDNARGVDVGRSIGSVQGATLQSHTHAATADSNGLHQHGTIITTEYVGGDDAAQGNNAETGRVLMAETRGRRTSAGTIVLGFRTDSEGSHSHNVTVQATGSAETRPRNVAMHYCIKF